MCVIQLDSNRTIWLPFAHLAFRVDVPVNVPFLSSSMLDERAIHFEEINTIVEHHLPELK